MTPARLQTIEEIFHAALDQEPDQIGRFVETACEGDELLRRKVEALLASHQRAGSFIEIPAAGIATRIIENGQADLLVGQTIGHYKILKRIGTGGMGEVYLGFDITAGRNAALKVLPRRFTGDADRLRRFQQEARAVVGLNHPNILTVYEIGEDDSSHYIASELIEGETLRQRLTRGRMGLDEAIDVASQVATALAAAHQAGIVHRDIKPENIMLRPDGYVKVLDFGIAKLAEQEVPVTMAEEEAVSLVETNLGSIMGTVRYMSPEQARGAPVNQCTDIWSLGVVLYEMTDGRAPFTGDTAKEVMDSILGTEPPPLMTSIAQTPAELQQIVSKTLSKEREKRYQSAHELLEALKSLRRGMEFKAELERSTAAPSWLRWARSPTALVLVLLGAALALALPSYWQRNLTTNSIPEKSIAVLPFENLSRDPDNGFFTDGVQDEILTDLAKIADLKVIGRTSVMQYKSGAPRNLREIGQQLGVAHVVEGSVQRAGNKVRVNAQLIDARTDAHLWAQTYDRDLADVFAIQGEIAKAIADQLQAKLSPNEKKAIEQSPTTDLAAFDLYSRAKSLLLTATFSITSEPDLRKAIELLDEAVKRDPSFFDAYCLLADAHESLYAVRAFDHTPARLALAEAAVQAAARLRPDAAETHLARAQYLYRGLRDYAGALAELESARRALPNDPRLFELTGYILRRRGQQEEGLRNLERAVELDPRNLFSLQQIAVSYQFLGRYAESIAAFDRALAIAPDNVETRAGRGLFYLFWKADTRPLHQTIDAILAQGPGAIASAADSWFFCALAERDPVAAERALVALGDNPCWREPPTVYLSRSFGEGLLARMTKDEARARTAFEAARAQQEKIVQTQPDYGPALCVLGLIDAALGRKDLALDEGRRAIALTPLEKDVINGSRVLQYFAITAAWAGDKELALQQLKDWLHAPYASVALSYGALKLHPLWDPLRGDPRFEELVKSFAPEVKDGGLRAVAAPEKSIAVLPFENLSNEPENAYFTAGIQEEILSNLTKIADLKVISRTSANLYKSGSPRNASEIGRQLGVAHLLEGSVQRSGGHLRVHAQLIDTRTDSHLWAQTYDRDVADIFVLQSEIAQTIVDQLQVKISLREKAAIALPPTKEPVAIDLYLRASALDDQPPYHENLLKAVGLLEQAVIADSRFFLAYCRLSAAHLTLYTSGYDHTVARREMAGAAVEKAAELQPDAGEVHLVRARYFGFGLRDYERAHSELELARRTLPNDPAVYLETALLDRRQGRWTEAVGNFSRAMELDPRNVELLENAASTYTAMRRYPEAARLCRLAVTISPHEYYARTTGAFQLVQERADLQPLRTELKAIVTEEPTAAPLIAESLFKCAILGRDVAAADRAVAAIPLEGIAGRPGLVRPREWFIGYVARTFNRPDTARLAFTATRAILEKLVADQPDHASAWSLLGQVEAALGRKEEAIKAGRRACDLLPLSREPTSGLRPLLDLAKIYAWVGEKDLALQELAMSAEQNMGVSYGELKLDPDWDPLRDDPRFTKIVASLAPKTEGAEK